MLLKAEKATKKVAFIKASQKNSQGCSVGMESGSGASSTGLSSPLLDVFY